MNFTLFRCLNDFEDVWKFEAGEFQTEAEADAEGESLVQSGMADFYEVREE